MEALTTTWADQEEIAANNFENFFLFTTNSYMIYEKI